MSAVRERELGHLLGERRLTRIATVGRDGTPHVVVPVSWTYNAEHDTIDIGGRVGVSRSAAAQRRSSARAG